MDFEWYSGVEREIPPGNKICGLAIAQKRPYKLKLEREDLKVLCQMDDKHLKSYMMMLSKVLCEST